MIDKFLPTKNKMINQVQQLLPGSIVFVQDFFGVGSNEAIRQQLVRLVRSGVIKRLSQGVYVIPKKLGNHGYLMPAVEEVALALARRDKARIIPTGEVSLWKLGLSTQVPLNYIYLTDGPSRVVKIKEAKEKTRYTITFKHASPKNFALRGKISSQVIQALKSIGKENLTDNLSDKIQSLLMLENLDDLNHDLALSPAWISKLIMDFFKTYKDAGLDTQKRNGKT